MRILSILLLFLFASVSLCASDPLISLHQYLSKEELNKIDRVLDTLTPDQTLLIEIHSSSGELLEAIETAKKIYALKVRQGLKVIVYIDESAIGPAAIFPFLADELYISTFVSWGDIAIGSNGIVPTNILRNQITSFINPKNPHADLLNIMASAMSDPNVIVVDNQGWKIATDENTSHPRISTKGSALVVNQNQLNQQNLISGIYTKEEFYQRFGVVQPLSPEPKSTEPDNQDANQRLAEHIKFNQNGANTIGHIYIGDKETAISQATFLYVKKALEYYKQTKPIFIILELNTPGGEVFASQKISDALRDMDTQLNIPIVAFINNWAISAGAMLAYSSRYIAVVKDASMGAAEPVIASAEGKMESASEKVNSAIRSDFANRAQFYDRNPYIAEAMVDKDVILVFRHGKVVKLDREDQVRTTGPEPDTIISPKGKLLTMNAEQMMRYGVADISLAPAKITELTSEEEASGQWPAKKSLLFEHPFFKQISNASIDSYRMDWKTNFFYLLANPYVQSLLFLGLMLGFYLEISTPGFGLPGTIAGISLFLIILSNFSLEVANFLELILFLTGAIIILVEVFLLPTFGLLGFIGVLLFMAGLFGMMLPGLGSIDFEYDTQTLNAAGEAFFQRFAWLSGTFILAVVLMVLLARYLMPSFQGFSRFVLKGSEQEGFKAVPDAQQLPQPGSKGIAYTTLRPSGKVMVNDNQYDAATPGGFIEKDTPIIVMGTEGGTLIVESDYT